MMMIFAAFVAIATVEGSIWRECNFAMPPPTTAAKSCDLKRTYTVSPTNRFVMAGAIRHARLQVARNATRIGGTALAVAADDRVWVATELGVQGCAASGTTDVLLPLPDGLPCDNVTLVGTNLYATSGERVFQRYVQVGECDKIQCTPQTKIGN